MNQRSSASARAFAAAALACGFLVVVVVVAISLGGEDDGGKRDRAPAAQRNKQGGGEPRAPMSYVVQNGDTLTSIARKTGVSVAQIQAMNPGVDPQILVSGEKLKLR